MKGVKTEIGVQSSVMAWDDPWYSEECGHLMRTGEGEWLPSQDPPPNGEELLRFIKGLGVDFYLHSVMPRPDKIDRFIADADRAGLRFMLNNEFGVINGPYVEGTNRYDFPEASVRKAAATGKLMGLVYDETEHLQMHPDIYLRLYPEEMKRGIRHQWASTDGKTLQKTEDDVAAAVGRQASAYGADIPMFSEQVFPVLYHALARGGMNPCPKVLKEEFQSLQLATALGAARQYKRRMGVCVDLWGPDVGQWFTRIWAFPGHSPEEYRSALEMSYLMGPALMYTENIDVLAVHGKGGFEKTEFGDIFEAFVRDFVPSRPRHYSHADADADIVLIRSDDGEVTAEKEGFGTALYGGRFDRDHRTQSPFQVFHLLSGGTIPANGLTFFLPQFPYPAHGYARTKETMRQLPLRHGVSRGEETAVHRLFHPLPNVLVFDERADGEAIGNPKLIFLAGSRMTTACLKAVGEKVRSGAVCIAAEWLLPEGQRHSRRDGEGRWVAVGDFLEPQVREIVEPLVGRGDCWMQRFGKHEVRFYPEGGDGGLAYEMTVTE